MSAPFRFPRFFVTTPSPCPYLPGKTERKVFTELNGQHATDLNDALGRIGFRRSQGVAYRPSCADCSACENKSHTAMNSAAITGPMDEVRRMGEVFAQRRELVVEPGPQVQSRGAAAGGVGADPGLRAGRHR